ncbi:MAG: N-acetylmuramoyl-L-alanine amidase [Chloroflexi bacterium]|nr:N-acetylmuramoyl-L-alanine amidase [Chloroflexota bacterium]
MGIDGPADVYIPVPNRIEGRYHQRVRYIVLHATRGGKAVGEEAESTIRWYRSAQVRWSAHALVTQDGLIVRFVPDEDTARHARYWDSASLSLVLEQPTADTPFTDPQLRRASELIRHWGDKFDLELSRATIMGHDEIPPGLEDRKTDPGPMFPWGPFLALAQRGMSVPEPLARCIGEYRVSQEFLRMWDVLDGRLGLPLGEAAHCAGRCMQAFERGILVWDGARVHLVNYTG